MNDLMMWTAVLAGTIAGKLADPIAWIAILVGVLLGFHGKKVWSVLALAMLATGVNLAMVFPWWKQVGIAHQWPRRVSLILISFAILGAVAYVVGILGRRLTYSRATADDKRFQDALEEETQRAAQALKEKWLFYLRHVPYGPDVPLVEKVSQFLPPALQYINGHHKALLSAPAHFVPLLIGTALLESKSHPPAEMNDAVFRIWPFLKE